MGERLVTSLTLLTATALIVYNGASVSGIITAISGGARAVISTLLTNPNGGGGSAVRYTV